MRKRRIFLRPRCGPLLLLVGLCFSPLVSAQGLEKRVQSAFLFNVAKFVSWPAPAATETAPTVDLCIMGAPDFTAIMRQELADKRIKNAAVRVRESRDFASVENCQILFISEAVGRDEVSAGIGRLATLPVLTVGDGEDFLRDGGIMRLKRVAGKLRFEVSMPPLQASGLAVSSKLLRLAEIVPPPER